MVKAIEHDEHRRTHPATALLPLEIPALGRFIAKLSSIIRAMWHICWSVCTM
jgi:hypothetical protein